jgi:hypothetical protein
MALPNICAALESKHGGAGGEGYVEWCRRYYCSMEGLAVPIM